MLEVGCFRGATTVWIKKYMQSIGIDREYIAIDTFAGFTEDDVRHEVGRRGKEQSSSFRAFTSNSQEWFDRTMRLNGIRNVRSIKADAGALDYSQFQDISFALIDLDLYLPVKSALSKIWPQMSPGGIVAVDDAAPDHPFDGAYQAYCEFADEAGLAREFPRHKLGVFCK